MDNSVISLENNRMAEGLLQKQFLNRLCYLFLIFMTGCLVGWVYEEIFYWFTEEMLRNRGILYGPWLPIYGIGALGIYALKPLKKYPLLLFLLCVGVTGVLEYIIGYVGIRLFGMRLWDYRGLFLNIDGIICFRSVVSFGIMGIALHYLIEPMAEKLYRRISTRVIRTLCIVLSVLFIADCILSFLFRTPITY
ncbi:MAG: putative ABC transporter permease [Clostridiales bacterium]|nr:putative ABC transporter permease [Clostridiales bacterium]